MRLFKATSEGILAFLLALICISTSSCDLVHDDLPPCVSGARLRFVYDYNMEFANAFPSQVDYLTLLIYDAKGNHVQTLTAGSDLTSDEDWRMQIDLPAGHYRMLAYGGIGCPEASFSFTSDPASEAIEDVKVHLDQNLITSPRGHELHHLYYGALDIDIPQPGASTTYTEATVYMMKDTNDLRIILANETGLPTHADDFEFSLVSDNTLMNYDNSLLPASLTTYSPWAQGDLQAGLTESGEEAVMAYAELSTSRLVQGNPTTLIIRRKADGYEVVRLPLINILLLYKSDRYSTMPAQEFLDRESRWNITFFLTADGLWQRARIVVNDWIVRINNITEM